MIIRLDRLGYETEKPANKYIFFEHFLDLMRLIYVVFILLLVLMTSAQCQQTAEGSTKTAPCAGEVATDLSIASPTDQYRAGENLDAGSYTIWYGKRTEGEIGQSDSWSAVPVTLLGGKCYLFDVSTGTCGEVNPIFLNPMMQNPAPHQSVVWYKASTYYAYVVCIEGPLNQASPSVTPSNQYTVAALATESDWNVAPIDTNGNMGGWVAVPWTIYPDGTMEAKGQWKAKWTATGSNKIHCEMTWMASGLTDTWDMVFDTPNTFYGYDQIDNGVNQNGAKFRYGERIQSAASQGSPCSWTGTWDGGSNYGGNIELHQSGSTVTGTYFHYGAGHIQGTVSDNKLIGNWNEPYNGKPASGTIEWTMSEDCKTFKGTESAGTGVYSDAGTRITAP